MNRTASTLLSIKLPTLEQTALAIAIIRLKPSNVSVRDYISQLRQHTRQGTEVALQQQSSQYIDLVAYWQDQCRRVQEECDRLQSSNIKLERSNHNLTARIDRPTDDSNVQIPASPRRKGRAVSLVQLRKRPQHKAPQQSVVETQDTMDDDSNFLDALGHDGACLTKALFTTHSLCRASNVESSTLCLSLVKTSTALNSVIRVVARNYEQLSCRGLGNSEPRSLDHDKSDFAIALSVCARAFMSILVGIGKLASADTNNRMPTLVVCELVETFKCALDAIQWSARQTVELVVSQPNRVKKGKPAMVDHCPKECEAARAIAQLLVGFLGLLEKSDVNHQKLFDGFVFVLLERVGQRLYYCTFGHHRSTTVEVNILSGLDHAKSVRTVKDESTALALRLELKSLVLILERAMGLAPYHMNPQTGRPIKTSAHLARTLSTKTLPTNSRARLSPIAKERLQRTLVTCMYGDAVEDEFLDVLTKPVPAMRVGSLQNVAKVEDKNVEEWYKQEVWRLVGWDVLAKESGVVNM
ncbi:hypothetical protein IAQ61_007797 [Plenodomus lingam]|uniref:uncharacterized protein n=1 Tax=Leptosphaeria maculans TaxID=5022 RepID=UPI00333248D4|nr:hypothetical protein IAQ61_007797 [Plenodomus lingam]